MSELTGHIKQFEKLVETLKKVDRAAAGDGDAFTLIDGALSALGALDLQPAKQVVLDRQSSFRQAVEQQLSNRRQDLENSAREAGLTYRRSSKSDRVSVFGVDYSNRKVKLTIGSEELTSFEEINGSKVVQRITAELARLNDSLLSRDQFFKVMKASFALARSDGKVSDGKAKIRELFPYIAVSRQLTSDAFRRKPSAKSYVDYSLAMFAYELSRFGEHEQGWAYGGERIFNQGPAMSTQHEAVVLPDAIGNPVQVLWVWIA